MRLSSHDLIVGAYSAGNAVASAVVRARWPGERTDPVSPPVCALLGVRRESGPDFVRRLGEEVGYPGCALGAARSVHGVFDLSDAVGGEFMARAIARDRRLARLMRGRLRVHGFVVGERSRRDGVAGLSRPRLLAPVIEMVRDRRLVIEATGAALRELAEQLKSLAARPAKEDGDGVQTEDLARAVAAAAYLVDALAGTRGGAAVRASAGGG